MTKGGNLRSFWVLWTAMAFSNLGDGLFRVTLPLAAVRLTRAPSLVAGVTLAMTLPSAIFALHAGVLIDRLDRRQVMVRMNALRALALVALATAATADVAPLPAIYVTAFILGVCETLSDTAASAIVPSLVGPDRLEWANSRLFGAETLMNEFVGPPLGGALAALGTLVAFAGSAATYSLVAIALLFLAGSFQPRRARRTTITADLVEGLRFVWSHRVLRTLSLMVAVMAASWSAWAAVLVLYAIRPGPLGLSSFGYGVLLTMLAIGGLVGTLLGPMVQRTLGRRWVMTVDVIATVVMLAVPALTANVLAVGVGTIVGGLGSGMWNVVVVSLRQSLVPENLRGRAGAVARLAAWGTMPLGAAFAGVLAELAGVRAVFAAGAVLTALLVIPMLATVSGDVIATAERGVPTCQDALLPLAEAAE
jgi:MFS family permease